MRISDWSSDVCSSDLLEHGLSLEVHPSGIGPLVQAKDRHMNKVFLAGRITSDITRSEEHTSELQSLMRISYAVFCLKKKKTHKHNIKIETRRTHETES